MTRTSIMVRDPLPVVFNVGHNRRLDTFPPEYLRFAPPSARQVKGEHGQQADPDVKLLDGREMFSAPEDPYPAILWLEFQANFHGVSSCPYHYDVEAFLHFTRSALQVKQALSSVDITALESAIALYRGPYLEDIPPTDWSIAHQEALQTIHRDAIITLGTTYEKQGDYQQAIRLYQVYLRSNRFDETIHRLILQCYIQQVRDLWRHAIISIFPKC